MFFKQKNIYEIGILSVLFLIFLSFFLSTFVTINSYWLGAEGDGTYGHGYLLLAATLYFLYLSRNEIHTKQKVSYGYLLILSIAIFLTSVAWYIADLIQFQTIELMLIVLLIWLWIALVFNKSGAENSFFPLLVFAFAMPFWDVLKPLFQDLSVLMTEIWLSWFGVTAYIDGHLVYLTDGVLEVSEGCSGLKYFLAGTALSIIYAELNFLTARRKIAIISLGLLISLFANWVRVFSLVMIADISKMQNSLVADHNTFGWILFGLFFIIFLYIAAKVSPGDVQKKSIKFEDSSKKSVSKSIDKLTVRGVIATILAVATPAFGSIYIDSSGSVSLSHHLNMPNSTPVNSANWLPNYNGFSQQHIWNVIEKNTNAEISITSYVNQKQGNELINYANTINAENNKITDQFKIQSTQGWVANAATIKDQSNEVFVIWFFIVGESVTDSSLKAKILQVPAIFNAQAISSLVTISLTCSSVDCSHEKDVISADFSKRIASLINVL